MLHFTNIDADDAPDDQDFDFISTAAHAPGQIRFSNGTDTLQLNTDADAVADGMISSAVLSGRLGPDVPSDRT